MTLFLLGLLSLLSQVVLLRELNVAFYGVELVYLAALAVWLAGTATGAVAIPRSWRGSPRAVRWLLAASAILLLLDVALVRGSRLLFSAVPGAYLPLGRQAAVLVLALVPIAGLFGLAFRWAASHDVAAGGTVARAYALESAGAAVAGLGTTVAFQSGAPNLSVAASGSVLVLAIACAQLPCAVRRRAAVVALLLAAAVLVAWPARLADLAMTRWTHPGLVETRDTPYARVTVTRSSGQVSVFENDVLTHESETAENEELPHLAALQHASPARILLLGGVAERVEAELSRHRPRSIEHVEMDRALVEMVQRHFPASPGGSSRSERLLIDDPRAYVTKRAGVYDLIVLALPEPVSGQTNRFYTREFFEACASRLAPGGILAFRLRLPENYLAHSAVSRAASVSQALGRVFPNVEYLPGTSTVVVASRGPLPGADELPRRLAERRLEPRLVSARYIDYLYSSDRRAELKRALESARVPVNSDEQPICYFFASVGWVSKFVPELIASNPGAIALATVPTSWRWGALAVLAVIVAACRLRPGTRRAGLALTAGLAGMALETVVLLDYQAKSGALFADLGVLVMAFMLGSAAGAWAAAARKVAAAIPMAGLVACGLATTRLIASPAGFGLAASVFFLAVVGTLVGALFATASRMGGATGAREIGRLYAADLVGGCLGGFAASLLVVPLAGLSAAAILVAVVSGVALLLA